MGRSALAVICPLLPPPEAPMPCLPTTTPIHSADVPPLRILPPSSASPPDRCGKCKPCKRGAAGCGSEAQCLEAQLWCSPGYDEQFGQAEAAAAAASMISAPTAALAAAGSVATIGAVVWQAAAATTTITDTSPIGLWLATPVPCTHGVLPTRLCALSLCFNLSSLALFILLWHPHHPIVGDEFRMGGMVFGCNPEQNACRVPGSNW